MVAGIEQISQYLGLGQLGRVTSSERPTRQPEELPVSTPTEGGLYGVNLNLGVGSFISRQEQAGYKLSGTTLGFC